MKSKFPISEAAMYPGIKKYFLDVLNFSDAFADGDETYLRLSKNSRVRRVDVVALKDPDSAQPRIDLVEAKLFARGHSFEACVNQLDSIRDSGDRLWVAFSKDEWTSLDIADRRRNEKRLADRGFGLLLVAETECFPKIPAPPNGEVTDTGRSDVLQQLGFALDPFLPAAPSLGTSAAQDAASVMALTCMIADILFKLEKKRVNFQNNWGYLYGGEEVSNGWYVPGVALQDDVICEFDPFGRLVGDGNAVAWVGLELKPSEISSSLERRPFGTHVYLERGDEWQTTPIADGIEAIKYLMDRGFSETVQLVQRIELLGRTSDGLERDLENAITQARSFQANR